LPIDLQLLRLSCITVGRVAPNAVLPWLYHAWFKTRRNNRSKAEQYWLDQAHYESIDYEDCLIATWCWGDGPAVLLVHGWNGRGAQLGAFIEPLCRAGYQVIAFDAPGHGQTTGHRADTLSYTGALRAVARRYGPLHGIIAHSFGVPCTTLALSEGESCDCVVVIGCPPPYETLAQYFSKRLKLPLKLRTLFYKRLEQRFGTNVWQRFSPIALAVSLSTPALIIHDKGDRAVSWRYSEALANAWPGAQLLSTQGLGHFRILHDEKVISSVVMYIREGIP